MHEFVSFNLKIQEAAGTKLPALSSAALYGKGIFTTIAIYGSEPFLWQKHWRRLRKDAARVGLELKEDFGAKLSAALADLIRVNKLTDARSRITLFDGSSSDLWNFETGEQTVSLIQTAKRHKIEKETALTVSPFAANSQSILAGVKSCNYLENVLALKEASARGYFEAARLNERRHISSACMGNLFWMKEDNLFTPSLKTGCLPGTTRELILDHYDVHEVEAPLTALDEASAIFLSSAGRGIVQIAEYQDRKLALNSHELTRLIEKELGR